MATTLPRKQLAETVVRLLDKADSKRVAKEIAEYLLHERRTGELNSLMRDVAQIRYEEHGILEATASSAHPIDTRIKHDIKQYLKADKLVLNEVHEPELTGGIQLAALDLQLDASVHGRLRSLKQLVKET